MDPRETTKGVQAQVLIINEKETFTENTRLRGWMSLDQPVLDDRAATPVVSDNVYWLFIFRICQISAPREFPYVVVQTWPV